MKEIVIQLSCELNDEELRARGVTMSNASLRYEEVDLEKKEANREYSEEMKALRGRMRDLSEAIRTGKEYRAVRCSLEFHKPVMGTKRTVRLDTGELVKDEPMTSEECQDHLFEPGE